MMTEPEGSALQKFVKDLIGLVLDSEGHERIYQGFFARELKLEKVSFESFCEEFVPAKLALGCVFWTGCCAIHRVEDKKLTNLFFKSVMELFETPKSLANATRFSESLYASNADTEQSPVLGILVHLFHKWGLEAIVKAGEGHDGELNEGFRFMMEVSEALKVHFEKQFDDFYYANEDFRAPGARKKA